MKNLTFEELPTAVHQLQAKLDTIENLLLNLKRKDIKENSEKIFSVKEAAQFLNLTVPTIYSKVSKRELPVMKRSKRLYFSSTELLKYIKDGRKKSRAEIEEEATAYISNNKKG